ncbi:MAG: S41 family peptidase [Anaerolineales bacterium]
MRRVWLLLAAMPLAACGGTAATRTPTEVPPQAQDELSALQLSVLEELQQAVEESFVYPDFGGADWESEAALVRHRIEAGLAQDEFASAIDEMVAALPDGTANYMTRAERVEAEFQSGTLYEGIGAFVSLRTEPQPRILLLSVIAGSPAEEAGLRAHDAVYKVDGFPVTEEEGLSVIERVRGPAGTEVLLEVTSPSEDPREVMVRRDRVTASDTLKGDLLRPGMLYILVPVAVDNALVETVAGLLQVSEQEEEPTLGLVLDLRIAGSSSSWPLTEMLTLLGNGPMGHFATRDGEQPVVIPGADISNSQTIPLAILVGPDTSGAPEVFAGALQATGRAPLVGLPTGGNVLSFRQQTLSDGSLLTFADSSYLTPDGRDLSITGLTPDLLVQADWDEITPESDPVLLGAINLLLRG